MPHGFKRPFVGTAGPAQFVSTAVSKKVRKASVIVRDLITTNLDQGTGSNVASTTLYRCGQIQSTSGAPSGEFVVDACTMVRFIFNGNIIVTEDVTVTNSVTSIFIVVARVEAGNNLVTRFLGSDNQLLTSSFSDTENIFYSSAHALGTPSTTSSARETIKLEIDMKAKRKLTTGDSIVMFTYTVSDVGTTNQECAVVGVSTVIAV